jgi:predicted RNA-binding Zn-ribbon protein involved in translation (DUF1610 family)
MSSFNILITQIVCPNCGAKQQVRIQFKFGDTWQLQYKLGDKISWGGNDVGSPDLINVKAYGIAESLTCTSCKEDSIPEEYDIFISNSIITSVSPIQRISDYIEGNGEYVILDKQ